LKLYEVVVRYAHYAKTQLTTNARSVVLTQQHHRGERWREVVKVPKSLGIKKPLGILRNKKLLQRSC